MRGKGGIEDEMVGWHHQLNGHEFEETPGKSEGQGSLVCCSPWGRSVRHDWVTEQQQQCVKSSLVLLKKVFAMIGVFSWQNSVSLWPALFCTPRPNLPVSPGISWLPTFSFQSPMMKRTSFFFFFLKLVLKGHACLHRTGQLQLLWHQWLMHRLGLLCIEWFALEVNRDQSVLWLDPSTACLVNYEGYSI